MIVKEHKVHAKEQEEFSFKKFFVPLSILKAFQIILIIGLIVFFNSLFNSFVYDDINQIVNNPAVHSISYIPFFFSGGSFFDPATSQLIGFYYRPIPLTVYTLIFTLFGPQAFLFHLFQVLLHCINALLVFVLFRRFFKEIIALFLAIIFLIHPINQEAVAYISDLQENLFFFFGMIAILVTAKNAKTLSRIIFISIVLLLGLFSKETAILFIPIIFIYGFLFKREIFSFKFIFPLLFITGIYLYLRFFVVQLININDAVLPIAKASLSERLITIPAIIFYYLKVFLFPSQLTLQQMWVVRDLNLNQFYFPLINIVSFFSSIFVFSLFIFKFSKKLFSTYIFFFCWFLLGIIIHLPVFPLDATVANRWFYFPIVGLLGLGGGIISYLIEHSTMRIKNEILISIAVVIIVLLGGRTLIRNTNWFNTLTLCQHDLKIDPYFESVQLLCGVELIKAGQYEEAKKHFKIAAQMAPQWGSNWYQYGQAYERTNDIAKARDYYQKSIHLGNEADAYISLAGTYLKYDNNPQEAKKIIERGLKSYPNYQQLQLFLAVCEYRLQNKERALEIVQKTYQRSPSLQAKYVLNQIINDQEIEIY